MELLILKSAACLAILIAFYKLFLERSSIHKFKRFYLLAALVISIVIPFITFVEYIEPVYNVETFVTDSFTPPLYFPTETIIEEPTNYLPILLWSLYGLGALLFASKFAINLFGIVSKINRNEKQKHNNFISVLLNDLIVPHTFFSYIFLNKTKFEAKAIPQEVLLHEQTHASQKHTLDILFIELLHIVFWFNPLLYIIKKDIKLNHEFLADDAVLKQGIDSSTYQETLLQFTSNANQMPLANAINYSLIKKRFTIMKTQTSRKAIWLRSLLLLPLLGGLLFSFSGREQVEKDAESAMHFPSEEQVNNTNPILELKQDNTDSEIEKSQKEATPEQVIEYNKLAKHYNAKIKNNAVIKLKDFNRIKELYNLLSDAQKKKAEPFPNFPPAPAPPAPLTKEEIISSESGFIKYMKQTEANKDAIFYNGKKITSKQATAIYKKAGKIDILTQQIGQGEYTVNLSDAKGAATTIKAENLTKSNTQKQLSNENEVQTTFVTINGSTHYKVTHSGNTKYYNRKGYLTDENGKLLSNKPVNGDQVIPGQNISEVYKDNKVVVAFKKTESQLPPPPAPPKVKKGEVSNIPPPPAPPAAPKSTVEHAREMANINADFYYNGESISSNKAIKLLENNSKMNISTHSNNGKRTVNLSNKPITTVNGKVVNNKPQTGSLDINGEKHFYSTKNGITRYHNTSGDEVDESGKKYGTIESIKNIKGNSNGYIRIKNKTCYYVKEEDTIKYYNRFGVLIDENGKALKTSNKNNKDSFFEDRKSTYQNEKKARLQERKKILEERKTLVEDRKKERETLLEERKEILKNAASPTSNREQKTQSLKTLKEQKRTLIEEKKEERKAMIEERKEILENRRNQIRRPLSEQFKGMEDNGTTFFYEGEKISEAKAIALTKENPKLNVSMQNNNGVSTVHLSKKGIKTVNGEIVKE
ncbi:M56 family metallopeptidase [Lacinutrix mariniflava]|uniref:M56 family metallopeptidase n=1 Tax=Lacinutrix mariniflava TaxID=342955 RepID=UPI0006E27061|nr:M56 family metallopeptidase [Lacinutrix mariniflava]